MWSLSWLAVALQGTGRYSIYVANYASGGVGPHALLEMDEAASDVPKGVVALSDAAAVAGVDKFTGRESRRSGRVRRVWDDESAEASAGCLLSVQGGAGWSSDQSWATPGRTCSVTTRMDPTSCSRIMETGLLLMWPSSQVRMKTGIVRSRHVCPAVAPLTLSTLKVWRTGTSMAEESL